MGGRKNTHASIALGVILKSSQIQVCRKIIYLRTEWSCAATSQKLPLVISLLILRTPSFARGHHPQWPSAKLSTFPLSSAPLTVLCDITPSNLSLAAKSQTVPRSTLNSQAPHSWVRLHTINKKPSGWTPHTVTLVNEKLTQGIKIK